MGCKEPNLASTAGGRTVYSYACRSRCVRSRTSSQADEGKSLHAAAEKDQARGLASCGLRFWTLKIETQDYQIELSICRIGLPEWIARLQNWIAGLKFGLSDWIVG